MRTELKGKHTADKAESLVLQERLDDVQHRRELRKDDRFLALSAVLDRLYKFKKLANLRRCWWQISVLMTFALGFRKNGITIRAAGRIATSVLRRDAAGSR